MNQERYYANGKIIPRKKYNKCPNSRCTKTIYNHTVEEARECESIAMRDA